MMRSNNSKLTKMTFPGFMLFTTLHPRHSEDHSTWIERFFSAVKIVVYCFLFIGIFYVNALAAEDHRDGGQIKCVEFEASVEIAPPQMSSDFIARCTYVFIYCDGVLIGGFESLSGSILDVKWVDEKTLVFRTNMDSPTLKGGYEKWQFVVDLNSKSYTTLGCYTACKLRTDLLQTLVSRPGFLELKKVWVFRLTKESPTSAKF